MAQYQAVVAVVLAAVVLAACRPPPATQTTPSPVDVDIRSIAVFPFVSDDLTNRLGLHSTCLVCRSAFEGSRVSEDANRRVTRILYDGLQKVTIYELIDPAIVGEFLAARDLSYRETGAAKLAQIVGEKFRTDGVVIGVVFRYREREGDAFGSMAPASVALDIHLLEAKSGKLLWRGGYDETQQSLSENVGNIGTFFKRGARWLTADDLARYGIGELLSKFPRRKE